MIVPDADDFRKQVISDFHDSPYAGHCGIGKTTTLIKKHYWWPDLDGSVFSYMRTCHSCQTNKARNKKPLGLLNPLEFSKVPWQHVTMDLITQLPRTRHDES